MSYSIFADESGTDNSHKCYTIGALVIPDAQLDTFNQVFEELKSKHGVMGEIKWGKINKSHGAINFGIDLIKFIIRSNFRFGFIVVRKNDYVKWNTNKEAGFYTTYTLLLTHVLKVSSYNHKVYIDNRVDSYGKNDEVIEIITNNMLNQLSGQGSITSVEKSDSKAYAGIQSIDLYIGAINASHNILLDKNSKINNGKNLFIKKISEIFGWDYLHYDTMPSNNINIWHFPPGYRATPVTREIAVNFNTNYIKPEDLL